VIPWCFPQRNIPSLRISLSSFRANTLREVDIFSCFFFQISLLHIIWQLYHHSEKSPRIQRILMPQSIQKATSFSSPCFMKQYRGAQHLVILNHWGRYIKSVRTDLSSQISESITYEQVKGSQIYIKIKTGNRAGDVNLWSLKTKSRTPPAPHHFSPRVKW